MNGVTPHLLLIENKKKKRISKSEVTKLKEQIARTQKKTRKTSKSAIKAEDKPKTEKPKEVESEVKTEEKAELKRKTPIPDNFTEENVLAEMKRLGSKNITSTQIRDHFNLSKEHGRGIARRMLAKLEKAGKVKIHLKEEVKRKQYLYDVVIDNPSRDRQRRNEQND